MTISGGASTKSKLLNSAKSFLLTLCEWNLREHLDLKYSSHRFALTCAKITLLFFLGFGLAFYIDLYALEARLFAGLSKLYGLIYPSLVPKVVQALDAGCFYLIGDVLHITPPCSHQGMESTLFAHSLLFSVPLSLLLALYYYIRHGTEHVREGDVTFKFHGHFLPIVWHFFVGLIVVLIFVQGTYVFFVFVPAALSLHSIPLFFIVQIVLNAIAFQLIAGALITQGILILPYSLHPGRR